MHRTAALPLFTTMLGCGRRLIILRQQWDRRAAPIIKASQAVLLLLYVDVENRNRTVTRSRTLSEFADAVLEWRPVTSGSSPRGYTRPGASSQGSIRNDKMSAFAAIRDSRIATRLGVESQLPDRGRPIQTRQTVLLLYVIHV